ncbi:hypothetical protein QTV44_002546 [Vibrio vulnificus]|nr:hypothetical protein [Vibrio vulnificus]
MTDDIFEGMGGAGGFVERLIPAVGDTAPYALFESLKLSLGCTINEYGIVDELHCHFIVAAPTEKTPKSIEMMSYVLCENSSESDKDRNWYVRLR